ncbi:TonB-dependent SusC/RagA subfamily outer membrane receptor [Gramella sp. Hel_I_59]|uniref:alpha-2-macroglobulin family protein n=1 Tax=Gramella sp. Hel_I_59 TaxID=1249978 RepID=UPI001152037C|nr:carboxypeptidase-like regulatory domain-containing protein [Gramella sp. Hel_I_59]TQI69986.1 TonB-dependent SusC/RagA subfamily outer membrane receptor [Gramella sp. Hel_I_59]
MKKLLLGIFIISQSLLFAQNPSYKESWLQINSLEKVGKVETALERTNNLMQRAKSDKSYDELIKSKIYHYRLYQINHENAESHILQDINNSIAQIPFPFDQVLQSYKAELLSDYYRQNRWSRRAQKQIDDPDQKDLTTWSLETIKDSIHTAHKNSVANPGKLVNFSNSEIDVLLNAKTITRDFRPSIYDLLAGRYLEFLKDGSFFNSEFEAAKTNVSKEVLFATDSRFVNAEIAEVENSKLLALRQYQELERIHSKDKGDVSLNYWKLQRIEFVYAEFHDDFQEYISAIEKLEENSKDRKIKAQLMFELANAYAEKASDRDEEGLLKYPEYNAKAVNLLKLIESNYSNTLTRQNAQNLLKRLTALSLEAQLQNILTRNETGRAKLTYKNVDTIYMKIGKVSMNFLDKVNYRDRADFIKKEAAKISDSVQIVLPGETDYNEHSTEIVIPGNDFGRYLVHLYDSEGNHTSGTYLVTNIAVSRTDFEKKNLFHVVDRKSGENLNDVILRVKKGNTTILSRTSDRNGEIALENYSGNRYWEEHTEFTKGDDFYSSSYNRGGNRYNYSNNEDEDSQAKVLFFLDRAIYRPGQKVHFKGVFLQHRNDSTSVVPNEYIDVFVDDPNENEIHEFRFKTNEYGSFTGSFDLPVNNLTGQFSIYAEEYIETDSKFWDELDDFQDDYKYFSVEEYKRPTFEVSFDTINKAYELGEEIELKGSAEAYIGASLPNLKVAYTVTRERMNYSWWRSYYSDPVIIETDTTETDENGEFIIPFEAKADQNTNLNDLIYRYSVSASVTDVSGETRDTQQSLKIGNKNFLPKLEIAEKIDINDTLKIDLATRNLNDQKVPATGTYKIYRLKSPEKHYQNRWWEAPEFELISKDEFERLFPNEPYRKLTKPENWEKLEKVYESSFDSDGDFEDEIATRNWKEGSYLLSFELRHENKTEELLKVISIQDPKSNKAFTDQDLLVSIINKETLASDENAQVEISSPINNLRIRVSAFRNGRTSIFREYYKLDGKLKLKIPLKALEDPEFKLVVSSVMNNRQIEFSEVVNFRKDFEDLEISTETFRNKIRPGLEETWSFNVSTPGEKKEAEVLASMYDISLDQFKKDEWNTDTGFTGFRSDYPSLYFDNLGRSTNLNRFFGRYNYYRRVNLRFDELSQFGFDFGQPNSYQYRNYLSTLKVSNKADSGARVQGRVVDENGEPLPGVNVMVKGSSLAAQTDFDGEFGIDAPKNSLLTFSFVGFVSQEYQLGDETEVFIDLEADSSSLDEVVVTGYGEAAAEEVMEVTEQESQSVALLQGKVAGVEVSRTGANTEFKIRGSSSISGSPLFIVDGKPVEDYDLDSKDIVRVEILKGAEATAIYGSRAADGVVIITTSKSLEDLENVDARTNLQETAFFFPDLRLDENGSLSFSFTTPEALTSWKLRLLAHNSNWSTGELEKIVTTSKDLNVVPNAPRFLREGDSIIFKVKVTNLSSEPMTGNAVLKLFDAVTMEPADIPMGNTETLQAFQIQAGKTRVVSWKLFVPETIPAVTYRILAKAGDFSDGEENLLPVLKNRMLVYESIPLFVRAGETENFEFENLKSNDSETMKNHQFTFEYTSNPGWFALQSLPYLMEYEHDCSEQIFSKIFANSVGQKIVNSKPEIAEVYEAWRKDSSMVSNLQKNEELKSLLLAETPWVQDAESESLQQQRIGLLFETGRMDKELTSMMTRLRRMQNSSGAFPWFPGGRDNYYITSHIIEGFGKLKNMNIELDDRRILANAIAYLDKELMEQKIRRESENSTDFYKSYTVLAYAHTRSMHQEEFPIPAEQKDLVNKSLEYQKQRWTDYSLSEKAELAITLDRFGHSIEALEILESLKQTAVKSETYGMYWKENTASWRSFNTPVEVQSQIIQAFAEVSKDMESIEELKIWLIQNKRTNYWETTKSTTAAVYALLMQGMDILPVSSNTQFVIGGDKLDMEELSNTPAEAGSGYVKTTWKAGEFSEDFGNIKIENNNTTAGYGGAYWQYFENLDKIKTHSESPLNIEKELYLNTGNNELKRIDTDTPLKVGDLVSVRLVVRAEADMEFIHLKDMRASGFEPTNVISEHKYQNSTSYYESTRDAATHFFFDTLRKGTYVLEYTVRANNAGSFSNGISTIESMYAPEFSGHTSGIRVEIREQQ